MKARTVAVLILAGLILAPVVMQAQSEQPDPAAPAAPAEPVEIETQGETPPAPETPQTHVRRHRMKGKDTAVDIESSNAEDRAKLEYEIAKLLEQIDLFHEQGDEARAGSNELRLEAMRIQLEALEDNLIILDEDFPGGILVPDPDVAPHVIISPDGSRIIISRPDRARRTKSERIAIFEPIYVEVDEVIQGDAVSIFDDVHVNGHVEQDVVSIGGNIYVDGTVGGNAIAPFGEILLSENAVVEGDAVAIKVYDRDGFIGGKIEEIPLFRIPFAGGGARSFYALASTAALSIALLAILLGLLVQTAAMPNVVRTEERIREKPVASFFGGMLVQLMFFPVWLLLIVTVIGIPVAFLALPLVVLAAKLLGFVAISRILGRAVLRTIDGERPAWTILVVGAALLFSPLIIGAGLQLTGGESFLAGPFSFVGTLAMFIGLSALYLVSTAAMGAGVFSRLGTRSLKNGVRPHDTAIPANPSLPAAGEPLPQPPAAGAAPDAT